MLPSEESMEIWIAEKCNLLKGHIKLNEDEDRKLCKFFSHENSLKSSFVVVKM